MFYLELGSMIRIIAALTWRKSRNFSQAVLLNQFGFIGSVLCFFGCCGVGISQPTAEHATTVGNNLPIPPAIPARHDSKFKFSFDIAVHDFAPGS